MAARAHDHAAPHSRAAWWIAAALVALVFAAFWPALSAQFLSYDDDRLFQLNRSWRGLSPAHLRWMFSSAELSHYYPLTWLTFGVDHALRGYTAPDGAPEAAGYHATNVALHAAAAVALFVLARRLLAIALPAWPRHTNVLAAAASAFVWAIHPLRVESVVWLTERSDVLSAMFLFLALYAWLAWARGSRVESVGTSRALAVLGASIAGAAGVLAGLDLSRTGWVAVGQPPAFLAGAALLVASAFLASRDGPSRWYALALALLLASLLSKAWGMVLPAVLLVLDVWPLRRWSRRNALALLAEKAPLAALAAVFARLAHFAQASGAGVVASWTDHTLVERIAQAGYGLAYYPLKTLAPVHLLPLYPLPQDLSLREARWLVPMLGVIAVASAAFVRRRRWPALATACGVYALCIAPVLGFAQSGPQLVADRYSYLATVPFALLAGAGLAWSIARAPRLAGIGALVVACALIASTRRQAAAWSTSESLWQHTLELEPNHATALMSLGGLRAHAAERERDPARKMALLEEALALHKRASEFSSDPGILRNVSQVLNAMSLIDDGRAHELQLAALDYSRRALEQAREKNAVIPEYRLDLGTDLINLGYLDEGIGHLRWYVNERPERLRGWMNLGGALVMAGQVDEGLRDLRHACELEPNDVRPWEMLAGNLDDLGRRDEARAAWQRVLALDPRNATARAALDAARNAK